MITMIIKSLFHIFKKVFYLFDNHDVCHNKKVDIELKILKSENYLHLR